MDLFNLAAKLSLDSKNFTDGLKKADKQGENLAKKLTKSFNTISKVAKTVLGGVVVKQIIGSLTKMANATAAFGDSIDKNSQVLGMSRKAYQEWDYILSQNGASIDTMTTAMKTMNSAILDGNDEVTKALEDMGVDLGILANLELEDQFDYIVHQFQQMPAGATKSALAVKLFGRQGQQLLPLLNQNSEATNALREKMTELGLYMSDEGVNASVAYNDAMDTMKRTFAALKNRIMEDILPAMTAAIEKITAYASDIKKAYEANGIAGVFEKLATDIANIKWPTWDDIAEAIEQAWNAIKQGAAGLGGIIFGRKEDGSVDWPTWDDVRDAAVEIFKAILRGAANIAELAGAIIFGRKEDGSVDWPTWETVKEAAAKAWKFILDGAKAIGETAGALVFGQKEDGSVAWPDWSTLEEAAAGVWEMIKEKTANIADTLGGYFFGRKEDGSVDWPSWEDIKAGAVLLWTDIKENVRNLADTLGGFVFGREEDGSIAWPDWTEEGIIGMAGIVWDKVKTALTKLTGKIFGTNEDGSIAWPEWTEDGIIGMASKLWDTVKNALKKLAGRVFGNSEDGIIEWPDWSEMTILEMAGTVWEGVKNAVAKLGGLIFGRDKNDGTVKWPDLNALAQKAWDGVVEFAAGLGGLVFGRDSVDDIKAAFEDIGQIFEDYVAGPINKFIDGIRGVLEWLGILEPAVEELNSAMDDNGEAGRYAALKKRAQMTPQQYADEYGVSLEEAERQIDDIKAKLAEMDMKRFKIAIDVEVNDPSGVLPMVVESGTSSKGAHWEVYEDGSAGAGRAKSNAKGLWTVPYDDYLTRLHRGERVLSASQARHQSDGASAQEIASAVKQAVTEAMSGLAMVLNDKTVGKVFGDSTSRRVHRNIDISNGQYAYGHGR